MRHQWDDPAQGALACEPGFVCCSNAQELSNPTHAGEDKSALCAIEGEAA